MRSSATPEAVPELDDTAKSSTKHIAETLGGPPKLQRTDSDPYLIQPSQACCLSSHPKKLHRTERICLPRGHDDNTSQPEPQRAASPPATDSPPGREEISFPALAQAQGLFSGSYPPINPKAHFIATLAKLAEKLNLCSRPNLPFLSAEYYYSHVLRCIASNHCLDYGLEDIPALGEMITYLYDNASLFAPYNTGAKKEFQEFNPDAKPLTKDEQLRHPYQLALKESGAHTYFIIVINQYIDKFTAIYGDKLFAHALIDVLTDFQIKPYLNQYYMLCYAASFSGINRNKLADEFVKQVHALLSKAMEELVPLVDCDISTPPLTLPYSP